ncbi:ectoine/hydroxyectoine ABC transporter substrate-binding protein EhuB [Paenibacillus sp.]|uniref:ectoine/hydroxyectoine ABC transporter substrate-binding protein EhuB n=1 Tax=Paenibacillus sp. TaxID=58172 RepID=UPI002D2222D9|nr:ectoine/hydroxyectoine ABC transporter substrate-binding protein EhuB [Paenibacillus sp.]HZG87609.1 ectoine/hydroxyectoine ABC transporter substrate-binding protein EhuB [Paenibacillus sp.]
MTTRRRKSGIIAIAGVFVLIASIVSACGQTTGAGEQSALERAKAEGKIVVGFANENPYAYETPDGQLTGEAVEVARAIFQEMGIDEMEGKLVDFGSLISGLQAKQFDAVTAGMFINPDRCKSVAFADPEYRVGEALGVKTGNPKNLHSYEDIAADPSVKVGVMVGAVEIDYMKAAGVADDQIVILNDQPAVIAEFNAGRVDAVTMTGPSLQAFLNSDQAQGIERVADFKQPVVDGKEVWGYGATAFRIEDEDFRAAFNEGLQKLKDSGKLLEILTEFGFTETELPGDVTAEQLCGA